MAIANATILVTVPGTTETVIYTASADTAVTVIYFCNPDTVTRTLDIYISPGGGAVTAQDKIYDSVNIPAGDTFVMDMEKLILANLDEIRVIGNEANTTNAMVATISTIGI
jgi:hypothetical protein